MARNNLTTVAVAVVATLGIAYTGSAWYFGKQIEAAHRQIDERIADVPYLKLVRHDYVRDLFGASEVITLELAPALFAMPGAAKPTDQSAAIDEILELDGNATPPSAPPAAEDLVANPDAADVQPVAAEPEVIVLEPQPPVQISIKSTIKHGPFPGFEVLGAGRAETTISFDEAIQKKLDAAFGGKPALTIYTLYGMAGGGQSRISSPPFKTEQTIEETGTKAAITGEGLEMSVNFTKDFAQYDVKGSAPRFEVSDSTGASVVFAGLQLEAKERRLLADEPLFYIGTQNFTLAEMKFDAGQQNSPKFSLKDFKYEIDTPLSDDYLDLNAKMGADEFKVGEQNYGPVHYDFSFKHLNAKKLALLNRKPMALYSSTEQLQDPARMAEVFEPLKAPLFDLLGDNLTFNIDRLSFHTVDGDANLSAKLALNGATPIDFASPMSLLTKIDFAADLAFPASLPILMQAGSVANEEEMAARKQAAEQSLAIFVQQGYATNEAGIVKTKIVFNGKELLINGQPFNPLSLAPTRQ